MKKDVIKNSEPTPENIKKAAADYDPRNRDFQRTEAEVDDIDKSEREAIKKSDETKK